MRKQGLREEWLARPYSELGDLKPWLWVPRPYLSALLLFKYPNVVPLEQTSSTQFKFMLLK